MNLLKKLFLVTFSNTIIFFTKENIIQMSYITKKTSFTNQRI